MTKLMKGVCGVAVVALLAAAGTTAQAADLKCRVPFGFTVNNRALPPGTYDVSIAGGILNVRGISGGAFVLTSPIESSSNSIAKLVFEKTGDLYVLREAWTGSTGRVLPASRREAPRNRLAANVERVEVPLL